MPSPRAVLLLSLPPLLWGGNAVLGRLLIDSAPPLGLNAARWLLAATLLAPFCAIELWRQRALLRRHAPWLTASGLLGMGSYNALLYSALHTVSPLNVTLIAASLPLTMLVVGALALRVRPSQRQLLAAWLSLSGVLVVVAQGRPQRLLQLHFAEGDLLMLAASFAWAGYSWLLTRCPPPLARLDWKTLLGAQILFGLLFALPAAALERSLAPGAGWQAGPALGGALLFIALGPSLLAYRCWALGVAAAGPQAAALFANLTPLCAAVLGGALIGSWPQGFHLPAFALISAGIWVAARR